MEKRKKNQGLGRYRFLRKLFFLRSRRRTSTDSGSSCRTSGRERLSYELGRRRKFWQTINKYSTVSGTLQVPSTRGTFSSLNKLIWNPATCPLQP